MVYIIQAEEQEITFDLLQKLAAVLLAESPGLTPADATYRIHSSHGMLAMADKAEAMRISQRFHQLGFRNFVLDELLDPPKAEHLNLERPELSGEVGLVVLGRLRTVTERTVRDYDARRRSIALAVTGIPLPTSRARERTVEESDTRFCLDLFTPGKHWRARPGSPMPIQAVLSTVSIANAHLSRGVRSLLKGDRDIPTFEKEDDYDKYVTWLYQLRFARS
jgi:hypothetical protein